jgi:DNA modification methylase
MSIHPFLNRIIHGDCVHVMQTMPAESVDLIVTDPPYLVNYRPLDVRPYPNDDNTRWVKPAYAEMYRLLKPGSLCITFYGYPKLNHFVSAWLEAGFRLEGHLVWTKPYVSKRGMVDICHESAYLLAKGRPHLPQNPLRSVQHWGGYTGNKLHPTQKPVESLRPLIHAYSKPGDIILDPFAGSGTTAAAARQLRRSFIGIELERTYWQNACERLGCMASAPHLRAA